MVSPDHDSTGSDPRAAGPRWLRALDAFEHRWLWNVSTALMLAAASIMVLEATARTLFSTSYHWAEEVVRYFVLWSIFPRLWACPSLRPFHSHRTYLRALPALAQADVQFSKLPISRLMKCGWITLKPFTEKREIGSWVSR